VGTVILGLLAVIASIILFYFALATYHQHFYLCPHKSRFIECTDAGDIPSFFAAAYPLFIGGGIGFTVLGGWLFHKTKSPRERYDSTNEPI
jgi:uncharacterized membrane protein